MLNGKVVLITGGTGSFGNKCAEILLSRYQLKKLIIFSRDEYKQYEMAQRFPVSRYPMIRFFIGDVRDKERLYRAFQGVDIIIHAAAMKQVPAAEYNPTECIKTNVYGAQNIINVAADVGVERVLALSTDKAANPVNLYGATKLCSDKLFIAANAFTGDMKTIFSCVRYGNVLGSRGSVIPLFCEQAKEGKITITDPKMTRFWVTLEQGVEFVLMCLTEMRGGELFVPKLPSMNIMSLSKAICPSCEIDIIGIRPGEKIHEVMVPAADSRRTLELDDYYVILPDLSELWDEYKAKGAIELPDGFEYSSNNNSRVLSEEQLKEMIASCI